MTDWSKEKPPVSGWWNASTERCSDARRYWHGTYWSAPCYVGCTEEIAERAKNTRSESQFPDVEWRGLTAPRAA